MCVYTSCSCCHWVKKKKFACLLCFLYQLYCIFITCENMFWWIKGKIVMKAVYEHCFIIIVDRNLHISGHYVLYMLCLCVFCLLLSSFCVICAANETVSVSLCSQLSVSFLTCRICRVLLGESSCWYCHYADTKWSIFCWIAANLYSLKIGYLHGQASGCPLHMKQALSVFA